MIINFKKVTIVRVGAPNKENINQELQWLGASLGLFNLRDKDNSCFRIFIILLRSLREHVGLTSDEIAFKTNLSRGTVVHHLNRLMESGLVMREKNRYALLVDNLESLVDQVKSNLDRTCDNLKKIAKDIDVKLGL